MTTYITALAGLLILAEQGDAVVASGNTIRPQYHRTDYESACGSTVFRVRFRNGPVENGGVEHLLINDRAVPGAAEQLQIRAARRLIVRIDITDCGTDPRRPVFLGAMHLEQMESRRLGMQNLLFFRLARQGRQDWRLTME